MSVLDPKPNTTIAFTDGACKGNPGAGGWGAFLVMSDGSYEEHYGGEKHTTNNQMELMGAIKALEKSPKDIPLEIWTDSSYVKNGITTWIKSWKQKEWKTAAKKPVKNKALWQRLDELQSSREVSWHWVKGHAGHEGNEKADELANKGINLSSDALSSEDLSADFLSSETQDIKQPDSTTADSNLSSDSQIESENDDKKKENDSSNNSTAQHTKLEDNEDWLFSDPLGFDVLEDPTEESYDMMATKTLNDELTMTDEITMDDHRTQSDRLDTHTELNENVADYESVQSTQDDEKTTPFEKAKVFEAHDESVNLGDTENGSSQVAFDGDTSRANPHFKPLLPDPIHQGESGRQLIMDTETTGLDALKGDRIIEVGIVELINRKFTGEKLHVYINPMRSMDEDAIRIHGISEAFLADKPTFDKVAQKLYDFMLGAEVIAHNAPFDITFLSMEFDKVGLTDFADKITVTDSLVMAKQQYPGQKNTLDALVRRLNVGKMDRTFHGALLDSEILAEVYLAMTGGQVSLAIDDDTPAEGGGAHSDFSHFANKIIAAKADMHEHFNWVLQQVANHPTLAKSQGIPFFTLVDGEDRPLSFHLLNQSPKRGHHFQNNTTLNQLGHSLFVQAV